MEGNNFKAPDAELVEENKQEYRLASRWRRLFASIVDSIVMMVLIIPLMYFTGAFDDIMAGGEPSLIYNLVLGLVGVIVFVVINGHFLISSGQTVGKKLLNIRIVTDQGKHAEFGVLVTRYAFYLGVPLIPVIGGMINLVNILFIFNSTKQCLHDKIAGTYVIDN